MATMFNLYEKTTGTLSVVRPLTLGKGEVVTLTGPKCGQSYAVFRSGKVQAFHGLKSLDVNNKVAFVFWRPTDAHELDVMVSINTPVGEAVEAAKKFRRAQASRNAVKQLNVGKAKAAKLQRTDTWFAPVVKMSQFRTGFSLADGFEFGVYQSDVLPETANEFLAGLAYDGLLTESEEFPGLDATAKMVARSGKLRDRNTANCNWPMLSVKFDLFFEEKRALKKRALDAGETFNEGQPLPYDSHCGNVWAALWAGDLKLTIGNAVYVAFVQSAAHAKVAQARFFAIREDLLPRAEEWFRAGMNVKKFEAEKGKIKPFFYKGLMFTGLVKRHSFDEMRPWLERAIVVDDAESPVDYDALKVDADCGMTFVRHTTDPADPKKKGWANVTDGMGIARSNFFDWLREAGLEGSLTQCRLKPNGKGVLVEDVGHLMPTTGKVKDCWGHWHQWKNVDVVLTTSFLKGYCAYASWKKFLASEPTFGWNQPATNNRTTNGQSLDTLQLSKTQLMALAKPDMDYFKSVTGCEDGKFNNKALTMAMQQLALEGFTPEAWSETEPKALAEKLTDKLKAWEHGYRRSVNTLHFGRPNARNLYLSCDYGFLFDGTRRLKANQINCVDMPEGYVVVSRNPQACALEFVKVYNVCDKSWGVPGCVHVAAGSYVAEALSGADYDGDQVYCTTDAVLMGYVEGQKTGVPILFDKPKAKYDNAFEAAFAEMQNVLFQSAAQNAARSLLTDNARKFAKGWSLCESRFWSAFMQLAVDSGKYGYKMPELWSEHQEQFGNFGLKLPGWKYTKSCKYSSRNRLFEQTKEQLELQRCEEVSNEDVYRELLEKYMLAPLFDKSGEHVVGVYDPKALIPETKDGKRVQLYTKGFEPEVVASLLPEMADVYKLVWATCGNRNANVDAE